MARERVLVTGASSGIGLELARLFAADGSDLVLVARGEEKLRRLASELEERHGVSAGVMARDLADPGAPAEIVRRLQDENLDVDVLVNNAGFGALGPFSELPLERQLGMIRLNVTSLVHLTRLLLPAMLERGRGGVLNVGSTAGFQPGPGMSVYYATKAFVLSFSEGLAEELRGTGVGVTCLAPGPTRTGFAAEAEMEESLLFRFGTMAAEPVARAGHRAFRRGKVLVVPGLMNRLGVLTAKLSPRAAARKIVRWLQG